MTTRAATPAAGRTGTGHTGQGQGMGHVPHHPYAIPYQYALDYLVRLLTGEAHYVEARAVQATGIVKAHARGPIDSHRSWHWRGHVPIDITILAA
jgi:hypothetical protein